MWTQNVQPRVHRSKRRVPTCWAPEPLGVYQACSWAPSPDTLERPLGSAGQASLRHSTEGPLWEPRLHHIFNSSPGPVKSRLCSSAHPALSLSVSEPRLFLVSSFCPTTSQSPAAWVSKSCCICSILPRGALPLKAQSHLCVPHHRPGPRSPARPGAGFSARGLPGGPQVEAGLELTRGPRRAQACCGRSRVVAATDPRSPFPRRLSAPRCWPPGLLTTRCPPPSKPSCASHVSDSPLPQARGTLVSKGPV